MRKMIIACLMMLGFMTAQAKTLVVYYSYTNNVERIVSELTRQIDADAIRVVPAEKGLDDVVPLNPDNQIRNFIIDK